MLLTSNSSFNNQEGMRLIPCDYEETGRGEGHGGEWENKMEGELSNLVILWDSSPIRLPWPVL